MFAHVASAPQNSATSNSELPFAAFRVSSTARTSDIAWRFGSDGRMDTSR